MKAFDNQALSDLISQSTRHPDGCQYYPHVAISTDTLLSGVHFPEQTTAAAIAHKSMAVNLSDLAAMGAMPQSWTLGLVLPDWDESWLIDFCSGLSGLLDRWPMQLQACDVCKGPLSVNIQVQGGLPRGQALRRDRAKPGDLIFVSGTPGDAGFALACHFDQLPYPQNAQDYLQHRLEYPEPRVELGLALLPIANAAIDISDGLAADLQHILDESHVGAKIALEELPASLALSALSADKQLRFQLAGGDDYELCFTLAPELQDMLRQTLSQISVNCTCIGEITQDLQLEFMQNGHKTDLSVQGYQHFSLQE